MDGGLGQNGDQMVLLFVVVVVVVVVVGRGRLLFLGLDGGLWRYGGACLEGRIFCLGGNGGLGQSLVLVGMGDVVVVVFVVFVVFVFVFVVGALRLLKLLEEVDQIHFQEDSFPSTYTDVATPSPTLSPHHSPPLLPLLPILSPSLPSLPLYPPMSLFFFVLLSHSPNIHPFEEVNHVHAYENHFEFLDKFLIFLNFLTTYQSQDVLFLTKTL